MAVGVDRERVRRLADAAAGAHAPTDARVAIEARAREADGTHLERVARARELILAGDLYQVNVARPIDVRLTHGDPLDLYRRLARAAPGPFGAALLYRDGRALLSTTPELLLDAATAGATGDQAPRFTRLASEPIKGTRPRGADAREDRALARALDADPKERAELSMIVDVVRNDLASVSRVGSVRIARPPAVQCHRTLHHRAALLVSRAHPGVSRAGVLAAMVPSGSVTGAPKVRAMEVIAELESARRGAYTGGLGFVAHDGSVRLAMAIRTLVLAGREGVYFTGGGIVVGSDPRRELDETRWKAAQLEAAAAR
jgi:anthranilate/para-aminobenzoate synthase component I